jgi:hypothetical protein
MRDYRRLFCFIVGAVLGVALLAAQDPTPTPSPADPPEDVGPEPAREATASAGDCSFFNPDQALTHERRDRFWRSRNTDRLARVLTFGGASPSLATASGTAAVQPAASSYTATIDRHIFGELERQGVKPAAKSTDAEFLRRVTLDLTGRIPTRDRLLTFLADQTPDKRARLVEELLSSSQFVDKWTMYLGDRLKNNARNLNIVRAEQGRDAFYSWIRASVQHNKPYDQMARELITADGTNNWAKGDLNWLVGYRVTGGPAQDIYDAMAVAAAETFLGVGQINCVLCHDGRGHLDTLSLWGKNTRRYEAWEFASNFSRVNVVTTRSPMATLSYFGLADTGRNDYQLNTTTGNRPSRQPGAGGQRSVPPRYIFADGKSAPGETHRAALARQLTADPLFATATVNYLWAELFGRGLVEPVDQLDPDRLDPDNPPPAPWTLQPSNARLLKELAADFTASGFRLHSLIRQIVNSDAYQLSARYDGPWNPAWEPLFARKLVRRLWAEEVHDSIAAASGIIPTYRIPQFTGDDLLTRETRTVNWAMQFPEPAGMPDGAGSATSQFLDSFFRGNRDDITRSAEGSLQQALGLMNDNFVMTRIRATTTQSLLARALSLGDNGQAVDFLYQSVLSRPPSAAERTAAVERLVMNGLAGRTRNGEDLLWSLYNRLDFIFNY